MIFLAAQLFRYGYNQLSSKTRKSLHKVCPQLKVGEPINIQMFKDEELLPFVLGLNDEGFRQVREMKIKKWEKGFFVIDPKTFIDAFFLAEGFNRESISIEFKDGIVTKFRCNLRGKKVD